MFVLKILQKTNLFLWLCKHEHKQVLYRQRRSQFYQAQGLDAIAPPKGQGLIPRVGPFEETNLECPVCLVDLIHA